MSLNKGDRPGHKFRGNQHTGGIPSGEAATAFGRTRRRSSKYPSLSSVKLTPAKRALTPELKAMKQQLDDEMSGKAPWSLPIMPEPMPGMEKRLGRCYELSGQEILSSMHGEHTVPGANLRLVHGTIQGDDSHPPIRHAWVETDEAVKEPASGRLYTPEIYRVLFKAKDIVSYPMEEAIAQMGRHHHFGPWDDATGDWLALQGAPKAKFKGITTSDSPSGQRRVAAILGVHPRGRGYDESTLHTEAKRVAAELASGRRSSIKPPRPHDPHFVREVMALLPQYITQENLTKGDLPGHPFHGNQWTGPISTGGSDLSDACTRWGAADAVGEIRAAAESVLRGTASSASRSAANAEALLAAISTAPVMKSTLWRGVTVGEEATRELQGITPGAVVDIPLMGASRSRNEAAGHFHGGRPGGVIFQIDGAAAIEISKHNAIQLYAYEDEWVTGGRYEVVSVDKQAPMLPPIRNTTLSDQFHVPYYPEGVDPTTPVTVVHLKQVGRFDPSTVAGRPVEPVPSPLPVAPAMPVPSPIRVDRKPRSFFSLDWFRN